MRVRAPGVGTYRSVPDFAWSGWRYRIPGGPEGGQYHGFIAPDSSQSWEGGQGGWPGGKSEIAEGPQKRPSGHSLLPGQGSSFGPWDHSWGGTAFDEGQTHSDHGDHNVYRSPAEMRPRPNASGGVNVIFGHQDERTPGYAVAPGNYRSLGGLGLPVDPTRGVIPTWFKLPPTVAAPGASTGHPIYPYYPSPGPSTGVPRYPICPAWGCAPPIQTDGSGATNVVAQPPSSWRSPGYLVPWTPAPVSPTPSPTVAATPADFLPSQGQVIDGLTPGTPSAPGAQPQNFTEWLAASTIIPGVANQWLALGGLAAFLMLNRGKK